ncbi:unnamed protein product [Schistocephalus solidus]|uniref:Uncharacterized protein n=1 Tax=Schistocephalus solidus TaxID=70667 RepID=A0A183SL23_SCHSO|nr:unnamed protein product [Schistocephalus solidus]
MRGGHTSDRLAVTDQPPPPSPSPSNTTQEARPLAQQPFGYIVPLRSPERRLLPPKAQLLRLPPARQPACHHLCPEV